jgi:hypothetical protein
MKITKTAVLIVLVAIVLLAIIAPAHAQESSDLCSEESLVQIMLWNRQFTEIENSEDISLAGHMWEWAVATSAKHQIEQLGSQDECMIAEYAFLVYYGEFHAIQAAMLIEKDPIKMETYGRIEEVLENNTQQSALLLLDSMGYDLDEIQAGQAQY